MKFRFTIFILLLFCCALHVTAQQKNVFVKDDSSIVKKKPVDKEYDSIFLKNYKPGIAIKRSAMLPGWGQYTNKKYWKIPLVYAGIGIPAYLFIRNIKQYRDSKKAFILATDNDPSNDILIKEPYYSVRSSPEIIKSFRNTVRQNADYSVLFFIVFWGLNVADAAVDAHLKTFNVNDDLSFQFKAGYSPVANTNGVSFILNIGKGVGKKSTHGL
jgi:hypothetical protein